jgi:hypothetical protein
MARTIIGVIVGYVLMFILNFFGFVTLYMVVGPSNAFKPGLYLASNRWIAMSAVIILVTGIIAGFVAGAIGKGGRTTVALAVVVIILGVLLAIPAVFKARANANLVRVGDVPQMEAAARAYWPIWCPFAFPFISAVGVLVGGKLNRRS